MIYIIDANNLAGKLNLLSHEDFDKELIAIIKEYFAGKKMRIILVFDSNDPMGDRLREDNIEVIYTPRDNYYKSADDKVLEIAFTEIKNGVGNNQITAVTDDIELREAIQEEADKKDYSINLIKSSDIALRIKALDLKEEYEEADGRGLSEDEADDITEDLMRVWVD
jgi:predicted RNA-binding protein with PIN domain